jgi:Tfp pilus assembly protein PilF
VPANGNQVLETLPSRNDPNQQAFARMRVRLDKNPNDLALASQLAQMYVTASRVDGDPRYLGYAQAVLKAWWNQPHPPEAVALQRAIILQSTHQFSDALQDLETVLRADPANGQAWLTKATVLTVLGDYSGARTACGKLQNLAYDIVLQTCLANVGSLNGEALENYANLSKALEHYPNLNADLRIWVMTMLGEMASRLGRPSEAETHFTNAMALEKPDGYLLGAYSDFLLDQRRYSEVVDLLKSRTRNDALLLRYALALKALGGPTASTSIELLRQRFAAAAMRGDTVHQREQARFELHLLGNSRQALQTALSNWKVQKEPADLRVLLEAATAANDRKAIAIATDWINATHFEDQALADMLRIAKERA